MSDSVKLVTSLKTYTGTLSGDTDQVLVVHNNNETVRVPFEQFKNSQTTPVEPTSPTDSGNTGDVSVTGDAVYTYVNGEWGKSPRSLDWGTEYLRIDPGNVTITEEQKDVLRDRLPIAEENIPGIVPLAADYTKSYPANYAVTPEYVANYVKSLNPDNVVIGLSAYDIAVKNGFIGTEEEWLESLKCNADDNPERPITMLLRVVGVANEGNILYEYSAAGVTYVAASDLIDNTTSSEGDLPILTPLCLFVYNFGSSPTFDFGGYMVTLPRKDADIMAEKWSALISSIGSGLLPRVTYLS